VILNESNATPMDLRFRLFGTYVRVHPLFWVFAAVFGWNWTSDEHRLIDLSIWVACAFVSILLHEFGHVWMGRVFGTDAHIILQSMGGLAVGASALSHWGRRVLVYAAGPAIQFALYGVLWLLLRQGAFGEPPRPVTLALLYLLVMNLYWPLFNLLPIYPLDGGQITRELCCQASPHQGLVASLWISLVISAVLALNALAGEYKQPFLPPIGGFFYAPTGLFMAIFFAMFAAGSWQAIQAERFNRYSYADDDALPWER
jgi:stage IV sporulation protein FB